MTGTTLAGRYALLAQLGAGGFGSVWRGRDTRLDRDVAVKLLHVIGADVPRFEREARALAQLNHPNIVTAYDYGVDGAQAYLVMELIAGRSLADEIAARRDEPRPGLPVERVLDIADQVLDGLGAAHAAGFVHRDLKPHNIMTVGAGARVKLVDFGIAQASDLSRITATGGIIGSLPYVSPEQLAGAPLDGRSDLYSLGCTLHELLTGDSPFRATTPASWIMAHHAGTPAHVRDSLPDVPEAVDAFVQRLLAKDPADRPQSAESARAEVLALRRGDTIRPGYAPTMTGDAVPTVPASSAVSAGPAGSAGPAYPGPAGSTGPAGSAGPAYPGAPAASAGPAYPGAPAGSAGPAFPDGPAAAADLPFPGAPAWIGGVRADAPAGPATLAGPPVPVHATYAHPEPVPARRGSRPGLLVALVVLAVVAILVGGRYIALAGRANPHAGPTGVGIAGPPGTGVSTSPASTAPVVTATTPAGTATTPAGSSTTGAVTGIDRHPCVHEVRPPPRQRLQFRCPLIWDAPSAHALTRIPVFATYTSVGSAVLDRLHRGQPQYFVCQIRGARFDLPAGYGFPAAHHRWWALTQGDETNRFGFVPEVYLWGGEDDEPDPGITRICTASDLQLVH